MAKRHDVLGVANADTVIGTGVTVQGDVRSDGDISIDGTLTGSIAARGTVTIGVNATVKADVSANSVVVIGELRGNIEAEETTTLRSSARLKGNISTVNLEIELGAIFVGRSQMKAAGGSDSAAERMTQSAAGKPDSSNDVN